MSYCNRKKISKYVCCLSFAVLFSSTGFAADGTAKSAEVVDRIVAVVNEDIVSLYDLNQALGPYAERIKKSGYSLDKENQMLFTVREDLLNQLVDQKLTDQEIKRAEITVSEKEIDQAIERVKETNSITDEGLREGLRQEGSTMEEYRDHLKKQILMGKLLNREVKSKIVITKEDVKKYYEERRDYQGEIKYHLRHIIMKLPASGLQEEKLSVMKKMEGVLSMLKKGQSFEHAARMYSQSPAAAAGGDLGMFKLSQLSPLIQDAIKSVKAGEFTGVLDTDQGFQIFYVQDIVQTPGKPLTEVSKVIEEKLYNEVVEKKFQLWLEDLRKRSAIKIIK